jgi:hypothetical protein
MDGQAVNETLERMGFNIGVRIVDDFVSRLPPGTPLPCADFGETAEMLAKVAFRYYLNVAPPAVTVVDGGRFVLAFPAAGAGDDRAPNPTIFKETLAATATSLASSAAGALSSVLSPSQAPGEGLGAEYVELPEAAVRTRLHYANVLCGVVRGALEMLQMEVACEITSDPLLDAGAATTVLQVSLVRRIGEEAPPED